MATITKRTWKSKAGKNEAYVLAYSDRFGERHKEQFPLRKDAVARERELAATYDTAADKRAGKGKTVGDALDLYAKHLEDRMDSGKITRVYRQGMLSHIANHVRPHMGTVKLASLSRDLIEEWNGKMEKAGAKTETRRRAVAALSRALENASKWIAVNPAKGFRIESTREERNSRVTPPTKAQYDALIAAAEAFPQPRALQPLALPLRISFAARTGLRASEQNALRWSHIDFIGGYVTVSIRVDPWGDTDTTKSRAGQRTIPLAPALIADLKAYRAMTRWPDDTDLVFPDSRGGHQMITNWHKNTWKPLLKAAGLDLKWHGLRHYAVSLWIASGFRMDQIKAFAGHSSIQVSYDRYGHLLRDDTAHAMMAKFDA